MLKPENQTDKARFEKMKEHELERVETKKPPSKFQRRSQGTQKTRRQK